MKYLIPLLLCIACAACVKTNKANKPKPLETLAKLSASYCEMSRPLYIKYNEAAESKCDAALFTALHGLGCSDYVTVTQFEDNDNPGKLCRRPGCTCFDNHVEGTPGSDSGFSKDSATGMQAYLAYNPHVAMAKRIVNYGNANKWKVCNAETPADVASKCIMTPKIAIRWGKLAGVNVPSIPLLPIPTGFSAHLQIVGIVAENGIYGAIADESLKAIKGHAKREPNNLLFKAMASRFTDDIDANAVAEAALKKFPNDRLPGSQDWCEPYLYQRQEIVDGVTNPDWLPCKKEGKVHMGTDLIFLNWVLQGLPEG